MDNVRPLTVSAAEDKPGIVDMTIRGELSGARIPLLSEDAQKASDFIKSESERTGGKVTVIIDLSRLTGVYDPEAISILADLEKRDRPYVKKTACFGASATFKFAGEIISALAGRKNISFVDTRDEALVAIREAPAQ